MNLPKPGQPINPGGLVDRIWYDWFRQLAQQSDANALSASIKAIATALGSPDGTVANIPPLSESQVTILQGAGIKVTGNAHDGYQIALQPISDSGTGTFKLIERDEYGRVSGSVDGGAADIPYDPTASGLSATDVQAAIDEIAAVTSSPLHCRRDDLTATTGNDTITLDQTPYEDSLTIHKDGVLLAEAAYSLSGLDATLVTPATSGQVYAVRYWSTAAAGASTISGGSGWVWDQTLTGWTTSGAISLDTGAGNPAPCIATALSSNTYAYIAVPGFASLAGRTIEYDVFVGSGTNDLADFCFGCDSSGSGQYFRIECRAAQPSGIGPSANWLDASVPPTSPKTGTYSNVTWHSVKIVIDGAGTSADCYVNGSLVISGHSVTLNGNYIACRALSVVSQGRFDNFHVY